MDLIDATCGDAWALVTGKKRNFPNESRDPRKYKKTETENATPISVSNSYDVLNTITENEQSAVNDQTNEKPPPIHINDVQNYQALVLFLENNAAPNSFFLKTTIKGVTVYPKTPDVYRKLVSSLRNGGAEFHTYQLPEDKNRRIVIKNLHHTTPISEIKNDLEKHGYIATNITNVYSRFKKPLPMFFIDITKATFNEKIYEIESIYYTKIVVEEPRKKRIIPQCIRCQQYGHTKSYCNHSPRCVKCGQGHESVSCLKTRETKATCANCLGDHPANYRGCQVLKDLRAHRRTARTNHPPRSPPLPPPPSFEEFPTLPQPLRKEQPIQKNSSQKATPAQLQEPSRNQMTRRDNATTSAHIKPSCSGMRRETTQQPPSAENNAPPQLLQLLNGLNSLIQPLFSILQQLAQVTQAMYPQNGR